MARVTFLMMPEAGHILPTLRVAVFLRDRGHDVCYLTVAQCQAVVQRLGFASAIITGEPCAARDDLDFWSSRHSGVRITHDLQRACLAAGSSLAETMVDALIRTTPDLVLCDSAIVNLPEATCLERMRCPVVAISPILPTRTTTPLPEIVLCPVEFDLPAEGVRPPNRYYCEPSVWRDGASSQWLPLWQGRRRRAALVYCSLGTQSVNYPEATQVLRTVCAAFDALPSHQLLVAAAALYDDLAAEPVPENVEIVRRISQVQVLEQADLIITHGGLGTLKEAVLARVPSLVVPFTFDQPANGRRVEYHGIGRTCPPSCCSADAIRHHVLALTRNPEVLGNLEGLSRVFWAREAEVRAGRLLHEMLSTRVRSSPVPLAWQNLE